jgi:hypothetical protein
VTVDSSRRLAEDSKESYDAFWHLRHALFWGDSDLVFALTAYFDDSGAMDTDMAVVGGYISTVRKWEVDFNPAWRLLLAKHHLEEFHRYDFRRFPRPEHLPILKEFATVANDYTIYAMACGIDMTAWREVNAIYEMEEYGLYPYPICARSCVRLVREWCRSNDYAQNEVKYIFDENSQHAECFRKLLRIDSDPDVRKIIPVPGASVEVWPLQSADFFAWETRNQFEIDPNPKPDDASQALQQLLRVPAMADVGIYSADGLKEMCEKLRVSVRA